jgi:ribonucleoside-diphosphate reductase alpha subunit
MPSFGNDKEMHVTKRNNSLEIVSFDKILQRIKKIGKDATLPCSTFNECGPLNNINFTSLAMKVIDQLYDGITTMQIDELSSEQCASMSSVHPDYSVLAGRIMISNHHKDTNHSFVKTVKKLYNNIDKKGVSSPLVSSELHQFVVSNSKLIEDICDYSRDYLIDYFGFKTLQKSYLIRQNAKVVERPQHMWLRVSIGIHGTNIEKIKETYELLSKKYMTHATPTLFNAGTSRPQLSSCYLLAMEDDSIDGIYNTLKDCALISKWAGGVGLHIHNVRASGSHINGTNGSSNGIVPMLKVFNNTAKYVDQGGGKRNGSFAIYLEPWHADIEKFLQLRKNHGDEELKARDLFYALWVPDLFMKRIKEDGLWTLMCPNECPGLSDVYGDEFEKLYMQYEIEGKGRCTMSARQLWLKVLDAQMETGTPYICYKDASNKKSNQQNLGTIKSSNLCCEIILYSDEKESAVCNLASIALPSCVDFTTTPHSFNFELLHQIVQVVTYNLNKVIDINFYPTEKTKNSNFKHRPLGIGVQGLADVFLLLNMAFTSDEARLLNKQIFETMYHAALEKSCELAKEFGPYESYIGSPASQGKLQFDLWESPQNDERHDWTLLKSKIQTFGIRNSVLLAPMPTASTSQILGYNECIEPITSNIYSRRTLAGEFILTNKYLMSDLIGLGLWNDDIKNHIIANNGSVQGIDAIPILMKEKYKTVWELPMKSLIDMAVDRGVYICQSQSLNLWMEDPAYNSLTSMHFYTWSKGLKTGIYYLRRRAKHQAQQFTIEPLKSASAINAVCEDDEICLTCSA